MISVTLDNFGYIGMAVTADGVVTRNGKTISQRKTDRGYIAVNNKGKSAPLHRLVAMAFIPNPQNLPEVNHIDGNKENNTPSNLEWCSRKQNMRHAFSTGLCKVRFGEASPAAKLTDAEVSEIARIYVPRSRMFSCAALAKRYGVDQSRIHQIVTASGHVAKKHAVLDAKMAAEIYATVIYGNGKHRDVAAMFGVSKSTVTNICSGKSWASATGAGS